MVFLLGSYEDSIIPATDYTDLARNLYLLNIPCELHMFGHGPHGVSLCDEVVKNKKDVQNLSMYYWTKLCLQWLEQLRK